MSWLKDRLSTKLHDPILGAKDFLKYVGPGLLVTVGFIDPGNWASNLAAGSNYGYSLLWVVSLGTALLILLQHNAAHLGIATGDCLAEATAKHLPPALGQGVLVTALLAVVATALAEILGGAIALQLLFKVPLKLGAILNMLLVGWMLLSNSYRRLEKWIIGLVSLVGLSFVIELSLVKANWAATLGGWVTPDFPPGAMMTIMALLGAVVMPHNLFLHSEIIQSREWNKEDPEIIHRQLKYEFMDTLFSMLAGWAINSAMIILAAATFFAHQTPVTELGQAQKLLEPMLGNGAAVIFGIALLFSGISATVTAGMAGGSIVAGMFKEPYDIWDLHTRIGVVAVLGLATALIFVIPNPFQGLVYSQMLLSVQLPVTILVQVWLTSSAEVMGPYRNSPRHRIALWIAGGIVAVLNLMLLKSFLPF